MTEFQPSRDLEAALFANAVYHSQNEVFVPPPGWVLVATKYVEQTGYSGEAWGRLNT